MNKQLLEDGGNTPSNITWGGLTFNQIEKEINMGAVNGTPWVTVYKTDPHDMEQGQIGEQIRYDIFVEKLFKEMHPFEMKTHAGFGICGEVGELVDVMKREMIFKHNATIEGKPIREGIVEETGDCFFYLFSVMQLYGLTVQEVLQYNAEKLGKRYTGLKYSDQAAKDRADKNSSEGGV
jgi:uncharacterized protein YabN with tetrapyrrole methylase and pyrophosphatase domain